jgi:transformation/transcription domain-associated protein
LLSLLLSLLPSSLTPSLLSPTGSGWTTKETVRSLAYSILADLVHHIRTSLSLQHLSMAVFLFSKNVHDETLPVSIQTMSCKLLLNLVECIRLKAENEPSVSVNRLY